LKIRLANAEELEHLRQIEAAAGRRFVDVGMADVAARPPVALAVLEAAAAAGLLWVAEDPEAGAVGFALVRALSASMHLEEISVAPSQGRRGIGTSLMRHVVRALAAAGHRQLTLSTFADVPWNGPFYRRLGFEVVAEPELSPELRALRREEAAAGLDVDRRVVMRLLLEPPPSRSA
jgi:ribosomal protein S18 acetylase RimI-like enzyme